MAIEEKTLIDIQDITNKLKASSQKEHQLSSFRTIKLDQICFHIKFLPVPHTNYFILISSYESYITSADESVASKIPIPGLRVKGIYDSSPFGWCMEKEDPLSPHSNKPLYLKIFGTQNITIIDIRQLHRDLPDKLITFFESSYPDRMMNEGSDGTKELNGTITAFSDGSFILTTPNDVQNKCILEDYRLNSDDWPSLDDIDHKPVITISDQPSKTLNLDAAITYNWFLVGDRKVAFYEQDTKVVKASFNATSDLTTTAVLVGFKNIQNVIAINGGKALTVYHSAEGKEFMSIYTLLDGFYKLIYILNTTQLSINEQELLNERNDLIITFKYKNKDGFYIMVIPIGRYVLEKRLIPLLQNKALELITYKAEQIGDNIIYYANNRVYIRTHNSNKFTKLPIDVSIYSQIGVFRCQKNPSQSQYVYFYYIESKAHSECTFRIVEVDLKSMACRKLDSISDKDYDNFGLFDDLIVCRDDQTLDIFSLINNDISQVGQLTKSDKDLHLFDTQMQVFEGSADEIDFKLVRYNYTVNTDYHKLYKDRYLQIKGSHNSAKYALVVDTESKDLCLYDKANRVFLSIGYKATSTNEVFVCKNYYQFSQDDSKIGMFLDNNHRYIYDVDGRKLTPLQGSSDFDLALAREDLGMILGDSGHYMIIWHKKKLQYYLSTQGYRRWQITLQEDDLIKHVSFDGKTADIYYTDRKKNFFVKQVLIGIEETSQQAHLKVEECHLSVLLHSMSEYENANNSFDKKMIGHSIVGAMHCIRNRQPHLIGYLMILCFCQKDSDLFNLFTTEFVNITDLINQYKLLDLCVLSYYKTKHLQLVDSLIKRSIDSLRYDTEWMGVVGDFITRFIADEKINECLSNPAMIDLMRSLLVAPTGQTLTMQLKDSDISAVYIKSIPDSLFAEKKMIDQATLSLHRTRQRKGQDYQVLRSIVDVDISSGSQESILFFRLICKFPDEDLKTIFKPLFYLKLNLQFKYLLIYSILDWIMSIFSYMYYGFQFESNWRLGLLVPIWLILTIKLIYEVCCIVGDWRAYFADAWNRFDLCLTALTIFTSITLQQYSDSGSKSEWLVVARLANMMMLMWRSVTWLRVFKPTRYLVTMILAVFAKMVYFLVILVCFIFMYAFMWRVTLSLAKEDGEAEMSFYTSLLYSSDIIFGNSANLTEGGQNVAVIQAVVHFVGNVVIALALLNYLIAIISGVYEEVNGDRDLHDLKELMKLINEFDDFWAGCIKILRRCRVKEESGKRVKKLYMLVPAQSTVKLEEINSKLDSLKQSMNDKIKDLESSIKNDMNSKIGGLETLLKKVLGIVSQQQQNTGALNDK